MKIFKNKKWICIFGIVLIIIAILVAVFIYKNKLNNNGKIILAEDGYQNFSWSFQYSGMAIFSDGTIYKWDVNKKTSDYKVTTREERTQWILKHGSRIFTKVTEDDLEEIEILIRDLEDNLETNSETNFIACDLGSSYITVWNSNDKEIDLIQFGSVDLENKSENSQKLISIIRKYLK